MNRLKFERENLGLSQIQLGKRAGVTAQIISNLERGRQNITYATAKKLALVLNIDTYDLMRSIND